jgi:hypothetical protein
MPTTLTLNIPSDTNPSPSGFYEVVLQYYNGHNVTTPADLVKFKFYNNNDDDKIYSAQDGYLLYRYNEPGEKKIEIYGNNKGYLLTKSEYESSTPLVTPAAYVTDIALA